MTQYPFHPTAAIYPLLEPDSDDFTKLVDSIRRNGLRDPITLHDGQIIDGRNRYRACLIAKVEPRFEEPEIAGSLADFVHDRGTRRNLTVEQIQIAAGRYAMALADEAREHSRANLKIGPTAQNCALGKSGRTNAKAAAKFGVGTRTVDNAVAVIRHAPELAEEVERGFVSLNAAAKTVAAARAKPAAQGEAVARASTGSQDTPDSTGSKERKETPEEIERDIFLTGTKDAIEVCALTLADLDNGVDLSGPVLLEMKKAVGKVISSWKKISDKLNDRLALALEAAK